MPPKLLDFLNMPRYQILYYIFKKGKLSCDNSKTQISRSFGYKSVGHFWSDFDFLIQNDLIVVEDNNYILGSKGKKEILIFSVLDIGLYFSVTFSILFFWYYYMAIKRVIVPNIVFLLVGSVMLFLSILFYRAIDTLKPELPSETNDLK